MHKRWTNKEVELLKGLYGKVLFTDLYSYFPDRGIGSVRHKANTLGLKADRKRTQKLTGSMHPRKYKEKREINTQITPENCYWLGFIAADGCIQPSGNGIRLSVTLKLDDIDYLRKLCLWLSSDKISITKGVTRIGEKEYNRCEMRMGLSGLTARTFEKIFNITPNKSLTLLPPHVYQKDHVLSFIAGYIDGDGSIHVNKNSPIIGIRSTQNVLVWIKSQIDLFYPKENSPKLSFYKNHYKFQFSGERVMRLYDDLLGIGLPLMERKWYKLEQFRTDRHIVRF